MSEKLTVATWNISGGHTANSSNRFDYSNDERADYFAEQLQAIDADVICLQESHWSKDDSLAERLAHTLGMPYVFETPNHPSHINARYHISSAILSRSPWAAAKAIRLPYPAFEMRFRDGRKAARYDKYLQVVGLGKLALANVHTQPVGMFGHDYLVGEGLAYAAQLGEVILSAGKAPIIIGGDLNMLDASRSLPRVYAYGFHDSLPSQQPTRPNGDHVDYLLHTPDIELESSAIVETRSDHYLCWATFNIKSEES